jgi:hypothetical protein
MGESCASCCSPALLAAIGALTAAKFTSTASNPFCLQLNGGPFSGDLGFFRITGKRPTVAGKIVQLSGRVAGLGPVFGTAVVAKDGTFLEIGATFFVDAEEGQIDVEFFPPNSNSGSVTETTARTAPRPASRHRW